MEKKNPLETQIKHLSKGAKSLKNIYDEMERERIKHFSEMIKEKE